jgi:hypothetical protein
VRPAVALSGLRYCVRHPKAAREAHRRVESREPFAAVHRQAPAVLADVLRAERRAGCFLVWRRGPAKCPGDWRRQAVRRPVAAVWRDAQPVVRHVPAGVVRAVAEAAVRRARAGVPQAAVEEAVRRDAPPAEEVAAPGERPEVGVEGLPVAAAAQPQAVWAAGAERRGAAEGVVQRAWAAVLSEPPWVALPASPGPE